MADEHQDAPTSTRARPVAPVQRAPLDSSSPLAMQLHLLDAVDADREARVRFEAPPAEALPTEAPLTTDAGAAERVGHPEPAPARRISPAWRRQATMALISGDLVIAMSSGVAGLTVPSPHEDLRLALPFALAFVLFLTLGSVYEHRYLGSGIAEFKRLAVAGLACVAVVNVLGYGLQAQARGLALIGAPLAVLGGLVWHATVRQVLYALRRRGSCAQKVVIVGSERSVAEMIQAFRREPHSGVQVIAACVQQSQGNEIEGVPVAGTPGEARAVLERHEGDTLVLTAWTDLSEADMRRLSWQLEGTGYHLFVAPRIEEVEPTRLQIRTVGGRSLIFVAEPEFEGWRRWVKSGMDAALTTLGLIAISPIMVLIALAVRLDSPGPVFFHQERIGRGDRPFKMIKFRSMYVDAEQRLAQLTHLNEHGGGPMFKMKDDPRITRVGALLRKFSLDELPQLFNVLRREMSLVGPRPPLPREVAAYEKDVHRRLLVKPGITGLWQVSGRSDLSWEETVRLDLRYVENWSLAHDIAILARTVVAVLARRGAY